MPGINLGANSIGSIKLGTTDIQSVRLGLVTVWSKTTLFDSFNRPNGPMGSQWTDEGHSDNNFLARVYNQGCRLNIPDGLINMVIQYSSFRFNAGAAAADDGYLEIRVGDNGNSADFVYTTAYRRVPTGMSSGVGIRLRASSLSIVSRVSGTDTERAACGSFQAGDTIRLTQNGTAHSMYRNGSFVGQWDDSGNVVPAGAAYRYMGLTVMGSKDFLGPRRFSAAIDSIECG